MNESDIQTLKIEIQKDVSGYRYIHTLSVADECIRLAKMYSLDAENSIYLQSAALLHDITKGYNTEKQLELAKKLGLTLDTDDLLCPSVLHAVTGAAYAEKFYGRFTNPTVISAIRCHTTGKPDMSTTDKLLYLADYIEPTRKHESCVYLRDYFYKNKDNLGLSALLDRTLLKSFDLTIKYLIDSNTFIHTQTIKSRNSLIKSMHLSNS